MGEPKKLSLSVEPMGPDEWRWEFRNYTTRELFTSGMSGTEREAFKDSVVSVTTAFSLAMAEWRDRANAAETALAALSLACAHCGPESAGPATDDPRSCATCYGDLILTDAVGAETLRRIYSEAVSLSIPASVSLNPEHAMPTGGICIYTLAMNLRTSRDGSGSPLQEPTEALYRAYLTARLERWGESKSRSEALFREFIAACLDESTE